MKLLPIKFDDNTFADALSNEITSPEAVKSKEHFKYLLKYLGMVDGLKAQYFIIEDNYISKDYLHDYAAYYAFCFHSYPKVCKRIHFFDTTLTEEMLNQAVTGTLHTPLDLRKNYLGFIVVKPIPETVIGFTLLRDYNFIETIPERVYWGLRKYKVHFFGYEFELESLAFQEQDAVLAACATTAIWSMLNKACLDSHTILKSPSEITKDAASISSDGSRLFPNRGLTVLQICQAISKSGLAPEVKGGDIYIEEVTVEEEKENERAEKEETDQVDKDQYQNDTSEQKRWLGKFVSNSFTKKLLNAYSGIGIPVILVIQVPDEKEHGLHAIAVSGFRYKPLEPVTEKGERPSFFAENIEKIFAHDDQFGPFVRIPLENDADLITPWTDMHPNRTPTWVTEVIISLYPKIRISYEDIEIIVLGLDRFLTNFFEKVLFDLVWDITIQFSEDFKKALKNFTLSEDRKLELLTTSMPKYIWLATCYIGKSKVMEFTFDATDVNNNMLGLEVISYLPVEEESKLYSSLMASRNTLQKLVSERQFVYYDKFLLKKIRPSEKADDKKPEELTSRSLP